MLTDIQDYWSGFLNYEYSNEILMGIGVFLFIIAALKIIRSSLKLLFWVVLGTLGAFSFSYGYNDGNSGLPQIAAERAASIDLADIVRDGKEDVLRVLCERLPGLESVFNDEIVN